MYIGINVPTFNQSTLNWPIILKETARELSFIANGSGAVILSRPWEHSITLIIQAQLT